MSILTTLRYRLGKLLKADPPALNGYSGRFDDWLQAKGQSAGYQDPEIAGKVAAAVGTVLSGAAVYERDSVTFDHRQFSFPVATALLWAASKCGGGLRVLDFGGGLGTSFFQNKPFMNWVPDLEWAIVEQPSFVAQADKLFSSTQLRFYSGIEEGLRETQPQLALLSSSLQYVERPYEVLDAIFKEKIEVVVIDRTLFSDESSDYVTQQHVPAEIFSAVIPTWIFSKKKFMEYMERHYRLVSQFSAFQSTVDLDMEKRGLQELGYLFVLRDSGYDLALSHT